MIIPLFRKERIYYILSFTLLIFINSCASYKTNIIPCRQSYAEYLIINNYLFDTGAEKTCIIRNDSCYINKRKHGKKVTIIDALGNEIKTYKTHLKSLEIANNLTVTNLHVLEVANTFFFKQLNIRGIIGMDIVKKFNWEINIDSSYIIASRGSMQYKPNNPQFIKLCYKEKGRIFTDIKLDDQIIHNVIIDTGAKTVLSLDSVSYLKILQTKGITDKTTISNSTVYAINSSISDSVIEDDIQISEMTFNNKLKIKDFTITRDANNEAKIGWTFFKAFNYIYINTKKKEIFLFY